MDIAADPQGHFEALFAADADPWKFGSRWYESRKRAMTLACLTRPRYASAYEPGCANGELSAALATRCDRLLISDGAGVAVESARRRVAHLPHVSVSRGWVPHDWPAARFDLIVVSEVGYYLSADDLRALAEKSSASLNTGGELVACHWRRPIEGCRLTGDAVHDQLARALDLPHVWGLVDPDFRLDVWCADARTVAEREALVTT